MRIVQVDGGLGNQMFQYSFFMVLKKKYSDVHLGLNVVKSDNRHQGYELDKIFKIKSRPSLLSAFVSIWVFYIQKIKTKLDKRTKNDFIFPDIRIVREASFSVYSDEYFDIKGGVLYYKGYWQSEKYFKSSFDIRQIFRFSEEECNANTKDLLNLIKTKEGTVSVHVRRGDYLSDNSIMMFGNICTIDYYKKALEIITSKISDPFFIFFSDDIKWVKEYLSFPNSVFADWNSGADSWQDMYLMSQCRHNVIANSSFSWWGAYLNENPDKLVIAPLKWHNKHAAPDICPEEWIRI
jgi:hypothetical protein